MSVLMDWLLSSPAVSARAEHPLWASIPVFVKARPRRDAWPADYAPPGSEEWKYYAIADRKLFTLFLKLWTHDCDITELDVPPAGVEWIYWDR